MTVTIGAEQAFEYPEEDRGEARRLAREAAKAEFEDMSRAMVEQEGLLNHAQAAHLLDVSTKRIGELVRLGKLSRFDFMGRTYVSMKEVRARTKMELQVGRPKRSLVQKVVISLKAAAETDSLQLKHGGFAGPYERHKAKRKGPQT
ncbi:MAG: hypothetical protein ACKV19_23575 [Verrucomicrobiales bacterium]